MPHFRGLSRPSHGEAFSRSGFDASLAGRVASALLVLLSAGACAPKMSGLPALGPEQIPELESMLANRPTDIGILTDLGAAYRSAGRAAEARPLLERALEVEPGSPAAFVHLGITYEELEMFPEARDMYRQYVAGGSSRQLRSHVRSRLTSLDRLELRSNVRQAVAAEATLAVRPSDPRFVAVYPFTYLGSDPAYAPLARAVADMLTTDLSQTDRIRVLERSQMQMLLEELDLAQSGAVDPATAARGGLLLGAGRIVQGQLDTEQDLLRLQAAVVDASAGEVIRPVLEQDSLARYFDLQKRLVLGLYESLGIQLTAAERERVERRPTASLQAMLEYGLGLMAEDRRDFVAAAQHYRRAVALDSRFQEARRRAQEAEDLATAESLNLSDLAGLARLEPLRPLPSLTAVELLLPSLGGREPIPEVLGNEGLGRDLILDIIIRRP